MAKGGKFTVIHESAGYYFERNVFATSEWNAVLKAYKKEGLTYRNSDEKDTTVKRAK